MNDLQPDPSHAAPPAAHRAAPRLVEAAFRRHLRRAVAGPVLALLAAAVVLVVLVLHLQSVNRWVSHTGLVIARAHRLEGALLDAQSQLRVFVLTGDEPDAERHVVRAYEVLPAVDDLGHLVADNPSQVQRVAALRRDAARWLELAQRGLEGKRRGADLGELSRALRERDRVADAIRGALREFVEVEEGLRAVRSARAQAVGRGGVLAGVALAFLLGPVIALTTGREMWRARRKYRTALEGQALAGRSLRESEERLRLADRRKDEFLSMLSHELRNPLAPIRNSVHILGRADPGSDPARRARAVIGRQVDHLSRLVEDLLDVQRISSGKLRLHMGRVELAGTIRDIVEDVRPLFATRSTTLNLTLPDGPVWVHGDRTRLAQIVTNLLQNARKFTDPGGHVAVTLECAGGAVRLHVKDDGVGIAPEAQPGLFEAFVQGETTLDRSRTGLGLGLSLVRGIAELHHGTATVRSDGVGRGAEFTVTLPEAEPAAEPAVKVGVEPSRPGIRRVLIVEDNVDAAESLRDLFQLAGHEVQVVHDGDAGVEAARAHGPDVVVCDLGLPGIDGYEVAERIRAGGDAASRARLVAVSGYASPSDVERAVRAGFDYHLPKPPDVERLLHLISDAPAPGAPGDVPPELATGHPEVDKQHAALLAAVRRMRDAGPDGAPEAMRSLQEYARVHLAYEERLMASVGFPHLASHREHHQQFLSVLRRLAQCLEGEGPSDDTAAVIAGAAEAWVTEHVLTEDRKLAEYVQDRSALRVAGFHGHA